MASARCTTGHTGPQCGTSKWYESREGKWSLACSCEPSYQRCLRHGPAQLETLVIFVHYSERLGWPWFALMFPAFYFSGKKIKSLLITYYIPVLN